MISTNEFYDYLKTKGVQLFTGVPDSLLKDICAYISDHASASDHVIAANEGASVGLAVGHYMATEKPALVYMQNSGFGNIVNPLLSIADKEVYSIPMLLMIGWRGQPGVKDEPQHVKQGRVNEAMLEAMEIPYEILDKDFSNASKSIDKAFAYMQENSAPFALLIRKGTFEPYKLQSSKETSFSMTREDAIKKIIDSLSDDDIVVSTTGKASREVFEHRVAKGQGHGNDFLTIGGMGHASQIALGVAKEKNNRSVYCIDGDGAALMHLGSLSIIASQQLNNYKHIVINNGAHDSVGGQPTVGFDIDFCTIAKASGYEHTFTVQSEIDLGAVLKDIKQIKGTILLEVKVRKGARADLGRPTVPPKENKIAFIQKLK